MDIFLVLAAVGTWSLRHSYPPFTVFTLLRSRWFLQRTCSRGEGRKRFKTIVHMDGKGVN